MGLFSFLGFLQFGSYCHRFVSICYDNIKLIALIWEHGDITTTKSKGMKNTSPQYNEEVLKLGSLELKIPFFPTLKFCNIRRIKPLGWNFKDFVEGDWKDDVPLQMARTVWDGSGLSYLQNLERLPRLWHVECYVEMLRKATTFLQYERLCRRTHTRPMTPPMANFSQQPSRSTGAPVNRPWLWPEQALELGLQEIPRQAFYFCYFLNILKL